jgi:CDP-glucose 4,6-dehydratase
MATNVMGTVHTLEASRRTESVRVVVVVTSDKCYENREGSFPYRENDRLGGADPYSASKGAAEIVTASYRQSFCNVEVRGRPRVALATARAGNVVGGGDWAEDRIVPDCVRALSEGEKIPVRNPRSVRPWQHVLEPLSGYLWLGARMLEDPARFAEAWNFGPANSEGSCVADLVERVILHWGSGEWVDLSASAPGAPREAASLILDCTKAREDLGWFSLLTLDQAISETITWYRRYHEQRDFEARQFSIQQIEWYNALARADGAVWTGCGPSKGAQRRTELKAGRNAG